MKIDGMDFLDWLHKIRRESEAERIRKGIDGVEWLRMISRRSRLLRNRKSRRMTGRTRVHTPPKAARLAGEAALKK
jgi:hypothetical protein